MSKSEEDKLKKGTKGEGRGSSFNCVLTGSVVQGDYIKAEGMAGRMDARLIAIVAEGNRQRVYLSPEHTQEEKARQAKKDGRVAEASDSSLSQPVPSRLTGGTCFAYGLTSFDKLFTARQLVALTTFCDLVGEAREKALADARAIGISSSACIAKGGTGAEAYADAVATYLAMGTTKLADYCSTVVLWSPTRDQAKSTFARQALPMTWDFAEVNCFADAAGDYGTSIAGISRTLADVPAINLGNIGNINATTNSFPVKPIIISTDPPYYDNIGYADLSDFFYVWLRRSLSGTWPDLFRRLTTPKTEELVATAYRHGGRDAAEAFFMQGMGEALTAMRKAATDDEPLAIYYAFKQSEVAQDGITSAGWASFLQAIVDAGLVVDGTWPVRTERAARTIGLDANALASSIVLVCRKRSADASVITRADFVRFLRKELPEAIDDIRKAGVGPVDMQQSVIGPGMGIFSRHAKVLEDDDSAMPVKTALSLINRVWEEIDQELDTNFDPETQVALAWYATYGMGSDSRPQPSGELITLANAKNIGTGALFASEVFQDLKGKTSLTPRDKLRADWTPAGDRHLTVWECVQHTARVLNAEDGGGEAAAKLVAQMGSKAADARTLAYRLFEIATQKGWSQEALVYNELAQEWPKLEDLALSSRSNPDRTPAQASLF